MRFQCFSLLLHLVPSLCQEVDSVFMLLAALLHLGDVHFTALTDADTAFPSDLQLMERGQCHQHMMSAAYVRLEGIKLFSH